MSNEEIKIFLDKFRSDELSENATFGIFRYGGESDESFIKANKEGLLLFAVTVLNAAKESDNIIQDSSKSIIPIEFEAPWIDKESDTFIQYIEPIAEKRHFTKVENKQGIAELLIPIGCIAVILILITAVFVGLYTLGKWVF